MKISSRKFTWTSTGCALALLSGTPAFADDTELLLINPDPTQNPKPNVMFILDTSGSMTTLESTNAPYNYLTNYGGLCSTDAVYWTDVDVLPVCNGSNKNYIDDDNFNCEYATNQMNGIGSYTNTMVQYRDGGTNGTSSGPKRWQYLAPNYNSEPVECQADSGVHGDGTANYVYAANGTDLSYPWTDDPTEELSWGSAPRNLSYTFYDGNYLNWLATPSPTTLSRNAIMREVTKKVLSSVNNLNVGLMRFNYREGGPVILGMTDLDANRTAVLNAVDSLNASGATPLSEVMYENALYWRGMPAHYGQLINEWPTNPNALASSGPEVYRQPAWDVCAKNYNVLLSDGQPNNNEDERTLIPSLPGYGAALGRSTCDAFTTDGDCLDDVTEYLSVVDVDTNTAGIQNVTTHTIGFAANLPILERAANDSGGEYFQANDVQSLTKTLLSIIANINDKSLSFSAPAVSVNTFNRTQNLNDMFLTMFGAKSRAHWPGNLKKYRITNRIVVDGLGNPILDANGKIQIDPTITDVNGNDAVDPMTGFFYDSSKSYWTVGAADGNDVKFGGAAKRLPNPSIRNLYTSKNGNNLTAAANLLTPSNAGAFTTADFGLSGATGEPTIDEIIRWARGEDILDEDNNPATTVRYAMGDPLHAQPAAIVYGGTPTNPDIVVYTATNDGYLHATNGSTGDELWSFVPKEMLSNFTRLYFDPASKYKQYGLDGNVVPVVKDANNNGIVDGADFVYLIFGMRRGGTTYYALDVTNKNSPQLLWQVSYPEMGESWSTPVVTRMDINTSGTNVEKAVVVLGGGYDTVHDTAGHPSADDAVGAGIHVLDLMTGVRLWRAGMDSGANLRLDTTGREMNRAIPNEIRVIDLNGNGFADRMYASDISGQIWRFDITNGQAPSTLITGGIVARVGAEGLASPLDADTRRFYNAPDASLFLDNIQNRRFIAVSIGTGYRAHPFDLSAADRFYSFRDPDVFKKLTQAEYNSYNIATDANFIEVSGTKQSILSSSDRGWKFTLPSNQKVLADSITFNNEIFFVAFSPDTNAAANCSAGRGTNYLYRVSVVNGDPVVNNLNTLAPGMEDDARRQTLQQGGIAPSPTILFPSPDTSTCTGAACTPPPIGCVGVECFDPGFENNPVRTLWTQDGIN
ncbi:MAG: PilC/PilY family type IV pilus protein [Proteobacteria bacterium]|nr:PilC/PilY family type IV pilus protein [Pseudomonadota bacterium]